LPLLLGEVLGLVISAILGWVGVVSS
jgi:hypothetical protein